MFEFLTGDRPSRKIRGEDHPDYGKPYGEFWAFLSSLWIELLGSVMGLDDYLQRWARQQKVGISKSSFIADLDAVNPQWGLLPSCIEK